jgi:uncharacterized protein (DUF2384 family)
MIKTPRSKSEKYKGFSHATFKRQIKTSRPLTGSKTEAKASSFKII